ATCSPIGAPSRTDYWVTDGTRTGTGRLNPDQGINSPFEMSVWASAPSGQIYLLAFAYLPGTLSKGTPSNIWVSDGTRAGTHQVTNFVYDIGPQQLVQLGGRAYFAAGLNIDPAGGELWSTDATGAGTVLVDDIQRGPGSSNPSQLSLAHGKILFSADDGVVGA